MHWDKVFNIHIHKFNSKWQCEAVAKKFDPSIFVLILSSSENSSLYGGFIQEIFAYKSSETDIHT